MQNDCQHGLYYPRSLRLFVQIFTTRRTNPSGINGNVSFSNVRHQCSNPREKASYRTLIWTRQSGQYQYFKILGTRYELNKYLRVLKKGGRMLLESKTKRLGVKYVINKKEKRKEKKKEKKKAELIYLYQMKENRYPTLGISLYYLQYIALSVGRRNRWLYSLQRHVILPKRGCLISTLNCIWWCGFNPGPPGNVEYQFIAITLMSTFIQSDIIC